MREHPTKRCDTCAFWWRGDQWPERADSHRDPDEQMGACRRNAPRPTLGDHEYYVRMALVWIAPENRVLNENWEEASAKCSIWPSTMGMDWCGEWAGK